MTKSQFLCMDDRVPLYNSVESVVANIISNSGGSWYDPSDWTSLRTARDGTGAAPTTAGTLVGVMLDKAQMGGLTAEAYLTAEGLTGAPLTAPGRHAIAIADANRGQTAEGGGLRWLQIGKTLSAQYAVTIPEAAAGYVIAGVEYENAETDGFSPLFGNTVNRTLLFRQNSSTTEYNTGNSAFFTEPEDTIRINNVATADYDYNVAHIVEAVRGSTVASDDITMLFGDEPENTRYIGPRCHQLIFTGTEPNASDKATLYDFVNSKSTTPS